MTAMVSFRLDTTDAARVTAWSHRLGIDRSELLRDAVRSHLARLAAADDAAAWASTPLTPEEASLDSIADWGPAEDWSDWADATG